MHNRESFNYGTIYKIIDRYCQRILRFHVSILKKVRDVAFGVLRKWTVAQFAVGDIDVQKLKEKSAQKLKRFWNCPNSRKKSIHMKKRDPNQIYVKIVENLEKQEARYGSNVPSTEIGMELEIDVSSR